MIKSIGEVGNSTKFQNIPQGKSAEIYRLIKKNNDGAKFVYDVISDIGNPKNISVLDIGCGNGQDVEYLSNLGCNVIGLDASEDVLKIAMENYPNRKFVKANIEKYHTGHPFDVVYCLSTLGFVDEPYKVLSNISFLLKEGGLLIFDCWNEDAISKEGFELDEDVGIFRHVTCKLKDGLYVIEYMYKEAGISVLQKVEPFSIWTISSLLKPMFTMLGAYSGFTTKSPNWREDLHITIVAKSRES